MKTRNVVLNKDEIIDVKVDGVPHVSLMLSPDGTILINLQAVTRGINYGSSAQRGIDKARSISVEGLWTE